MREYVAEYNGKTGYCTNNQFARYEEVVYSGSGYHHAKSHDDEFNPELFGSDNI
jgi:hypothetical protein